MLHTKLFAFGFKFEYRNRASLEFAEDRRAGCAMEANSCRENNFVQAARCETRSRKISRFTDEDETIWEGANS